VTSHSAEYLHWLLWNRLWREKARMRDSAILLIAAGRPHRRTAAAAAAGGIAETSSNSSGPLGKIESLPRVSSTSRFGMLSMVELTFQVSFSRPPLCPFLVEFFDLFCRVVIAFLFL
jgi:hypothetical protein